MLIADAHHVLKERSPAQSSVVVLETLTFSRQRESLTGEPCKTNIKRRDVLFVYFCNVSGNVKIIFEISLVCFLSEFIPF